MKQNKFMRFMTSRALILTLQVVASGVLLYFVYLTKLLPVKYCCFGSIGFIVLDYYSNRKEKNC